MYNCRGQLFANFLSGNEDEAVMENEIQDEIIFCYCCEFVHEKKNFENSWLFWCDVLTATPINLGINRKLRIPIDWLIVV